MSITETPIFTHAYGPGFDFRAYHERRLVAEHGANLVVRGVSRALMEQASPDISVLPIHEAQLDGIVGSIGALNETVELGFVALTEELEQLNDGVNELNQTAYEIRDALVVGFDGISTQLASLEHQLNDIGDYLSNPEKTWAFEQYKNGLKLFDVGLIEDARDSFELAINGSPGLSIGVKTDYRFHAMLGACYIPRFGSSDASLLDTKKARSAFLNALRYYVIAEDKTKGTEAALNSATAWASYCDENFTEALQYYQKAWSLEKDDQSGYGLLKTLFHLDETNGADEILEYLILTQREKFLAQAASDPDFIKHEKLILEKFTQCKTALKSISSELLGDLSAAYEELNQLIADSREILKPDSLVEKERSAYVLEWLETAANEMSFDELRAPLTQNFWGLFSSTTGIIKTILTNKSNEESTHSRNAEGHQKSVGSERRSWRIFKSPADKAIELAKPGPISRMPIETPGHPIYELDTRLRELIKKAEDSFQKRQRLLKKFDAILKIGGLPRD